MLEEAKCARCGKEFYPTAEHVYKDYFNKKYCSWTCYNHRNDGKQKVYKEVEQYTLDGEFVRDFKSANEAAEFVGCNPSNIRMVCLGKNKSCAKFLWKYKE